MAIKIRKGLRIVQRGGIWYREERIDGSPVRVSLETSDEKEALRKAAAGVEVSGRPFPRSRGPEVLTLGNAFQEYREWFEKSHKEGGIRRGLPTVEKFVDTVGAETDCRAVTREHLQRFIDAKEGLSPVTIRNEFGRVRAFIRRTARRHPGTIDARIVEAIDLPKDTGTGRPIPDPETVRAILRRLSDHPWLGDYVTVLLETGMRPGELLAVRGVDLREVKGAWMLDIKPWGSWSPKSKWSIRTIQLTETAARILQDRRNRLFSKSVPIFCSATGEMRNIQNVSHVYRDALRDADGEIPPVFESANLYCWRHVFASMHAQPGPAFMELQTLAAYMGHSPGSTHTLERWYVDRAAMRRGAPPSLVEPVENGKVIPMKRGKT